MALSTTLNRSLGWLFSLLIPLAFGLYSVKLGQDMSWDLLNYHLYNSYAYLNDRLSLDLAPAGLQTYFNPFLDVVYFIAISHLSPQTVGFLLGFIQGLNFILVYKISGNVLGKHKLSNIYSLLLALAGVLSVGFLSEVGTMMNDSLITLFVLLSLWLAISFAGSLSDNKHPTIALILCSGLLIGTGCGLKLVISIYALSICLSFFVLPVSWITRLKIAFIFGVSVLVGLLATGGYWMFTVWSTFGNPLFPQFNHIFHGELAKLVPIHDGRFLLKTIFEKIFYPAIITVNPYRASELKYEQISWLFAYVATLSLLASRVVKLFNTGHEQRPWSSEVSFLVAFFSISYLLWLNMFGIYRYLIPIEILIPLLLFITIGNFFNSPFSRAGALFFIVMITTFNSRGFPDWGHSPWSETIYHVEANPISTGPEPAAVYLVGQPLAWIIPALDIKAPFIQIGSNIPVSEAYWQRAKILTKDRDGKSFLVFESDTPAMMDLAKAGLANLDLYLNSTSCNHLAVYLGSVKSEYTYCEVNKAENNK
ncbi:hypothetical protein [Methylobacter psychrophilus]|uniref:hypothetical protein n=1 Tax=Methylobacter psychrophilus TaxID=96941 RepID=UPI0021D4B79D|nr:hypothetical protein [Methylobacter psychrophilus]